MASNMSVVPEAVLTATLAAHSRKQEVLRKSMEEIVTEAGLPGWKKKK